MPAQAQKGKLLPVVLEAARICGTVTELARRMKVRQPSLYDWKKRVPAERVAALEKATNGQIPRWRIRPDLYSRPPRG